MFTNAYKVRQEAIQNLLYDPVQFTWHDYNISCDCLSTEVTAASWIPLWASVVDSSSYFTEDVKENIVLSLENSGLIQAGGILTTLVQTGQQVYRCLKFTTL